MTGFDDLLVPPSDFLSTEEIEMLRELMNIGFGNAGAELESELGFNVHLDIPRVDVLPIDELLGYFKLATDLGEKSCVILQQFWGDFSGTGVLVLPSRSSRDLLRFFDGGIAWNPEASGDALEKGVVLEIGNILTGACIGKITELLGTFVTYTPPTFHYGREFESDLDELASDSEVAIILRTYFRFEKEGVDGYLFVTSTEESLSWLEKALKRFVEQYA